MHEEPSPAVPGLHAAFGIRGIGYHFDETVPIDELPRLAADPQLLSRFKLGGHQYYARSHVSIAEQAVLSARRTLHNSALTADAIDAVIIGTSELRDWKGFPEALAAEVLLALGLKDILVVGVTMAGCANYASALRMARNMIIAEGCRNILVIETNQVRGDLDRVWATEKNAAYIFGDGAVSCIATAAANGDFRVLGMEQIVKPLPPGVQSTDFIANNVGGLRHVVSRALAQAGAEPEQVAKVFIHNINFHVAVGLVHAVGYHHEKLYARNIKRTAHVWGADNLIGLHDYCAAENPPAGTLFLMLCQADTYFSAIVCDKR
jgi:3-oxoacyl-[acyl-carrier-protein] synthase III